MPVTNDLQTTFFNQIDAKIPVNVILVEEIAEVLGISTDSAYRRIRGEKILTLEEFYKLCKHYNISSDRLFSRQSGQICFNTYILDEDNFRFDKWLSNVLNDFKTVSKMTNPQLIFIVNELNLLQLLQFPELAAFKLFFWSKSNIQFSDYHDLKFSIQEIGPDVMEVGQELVKYYIQLPTIELITFETLSSMLKQILFYHVSGFFEKTEDALIICDKLVDLIDHLKRQSEVGYKFPYGYENVGKKNNFLCYYNDLILTDNTILFSSKEIYLTYITNNAINLLHTDSKDYFNRNYHWAKNIVSQSTLISGTAEKERNMFFRELKKKILQTKIELET